MPIKDDLYCLLNEAKNGDREARECLIKKYTPFILKATSKQCGRYIYLSQDDEASISLLAFDEAITSFNLGKNISFLSFAEMVIKRRLIDYFRKEKRKIELVPFSLYKDSEDSEENFNQYTIEGKSAIKAYSKAEEAKARREEILFYNERLREFGLSFQELVEVSPKHQDARVNAIKAAKIIAKDDRLRHKLLEKKVLPLKEVSLMVEVSRKTLERNRKYIIAVFLILVSEFTYLKEYLKI